jgi:NAD(P)-dependent dehydrogenase (short-subunit alcohol dehydrogenase family)
MAISGKVVIVTGAGSGIGRALAAGFVADGARVIGFERNADGLEETQRMCGDKLVAVAGDVTSEADVERLVATALERYGRIDVLINNAGIAHIGRLLARPFADWAAVVEVNLIGLARCTYHVLPHMLERGHGRIVNVTSRGAESGRPEYSAYSASKAGVNLFTKTLAREMLSQGQRDVLVNALIPGVTTTPLGEGRPEHIGQEPAAVYPHARFVADLPESGPTGRIFLYSEDHAAYLRFNEPIEDAVEQSAPAAPGGRS